MRLLSVDTGCAAAAVGDRLQQRTFAGEAGGHGRRAVRPSLGATATEPCTARQSPAGHCRFGADQFDESKPQEAKLIPRFFNWFYLAINCGAVLAATVVVNVQTKSWEAGFLIPCVAFAIAISIFLLGSKLYR